MSDWNDTAVWDRIAYKPENSRAALTAIMGEGLRALLVRAYVVCDGDDSDAVAFRRDAKAALEGKGG